MSTALSREKKNEQQQQQKKTITYLFSFTRCVLDYF